MDGIAPAAGAGPAEPTVDPDINAAVARDFGIEIPEPETAAAPAAAAPPVAEPETPAEAAPAEGTTPEEGAAAEPTPAEKMQELLDSVEGDAAKLDPEKVPEELRPFLKGFQRSYTSKFEALAAERKKSAEELAGDELATLKAEIDTLKAAKEQPAAPAPQPVQAPATQGPTAEQIHAHVVQSVEHDFGKLITLEAAMASPDPKMLELYLDQKAEIASRTATIRGQIATNARIQQLEASFDQRQTTANAEASAQAQWNAAVEAEPRLAEFDNEVGALLSLTTPDGGYKYTLEQAAALVLGAATREQDIAQAIAVGTHVGAQQATQVAANKNNFSVPSASTAAKGGPEITADMTVDEVARLATADL